MYSLAEWQKLPKDDKKIIINSSVPDGTDSWVPWTIGMCYSWIDAKENKDINDILIGDHHNLVLCAINIHTDQNRRGSSSITRKIISQTLSNNGIQNIQIENKKYFETLANYKFIISPEGNGIDCHRHYEALMSGCIPIVEDNPLIRKKYKNLPVIYTKDYSEINSEYLNMKYQEMLNKTYDFSSLYYDYYPEFIQNIIKFNGVYWVKRLLAKQIKL